MRHRYALHVCCHPGSPPPHTGVAASSSSAFFVFVFFSCYCCCYRYCDCPILLFPSFPTPTFALGTNIKSSWLSGMGRYSSWTWTGKRKFYKFVLSFSLSIPIPQSYWRDSCQCSSLHTCAFGTSRVKSAIGTPCVLLQP